MQQGQITGLNKHAWLMFNSAETHCFIQQANLFNENKIRMLNLTKFCPILHFFLVTEFSFNVTKQKSFLMLEMLLN